MARTVLVVGATGVLGAPVARALAAAGHSVRALVHRADATLPAGVTKLHGDVLDRASIRAALEGCDAVHVSLRGRTLDEARQVELEGARTVATEAAALGVQRLTYLSNCGLKRATASDPFRTLKLDVEDAIVGSGVPYTILRATHFMESLPMFVRNGKAEILGRQPHAYHYLAVEDFARIVVDALENPATANRILDVLGPEPFTMGDALQRYLDKVMPGQKAGTVPLPILRIVSSLKGDAQLKHAVALFSAFQKQPEDGDPAPVAGLFGAPRTTMAAWLAAQPRAA